ncbi:biotin/lipoate A/B protein ligase family protein [Acanthamoeba castellanii str. Neff]|uniref:Biotin/lipoate A/B protein ligase family protein n=1 Tax=Acanthamoeba castellanii (strain ATCC 30010 / Neff) TaxID=1257118 RepID=L8GJH6_ACACF|nr:biotin/lipoate A/B protein ligase family protein [Acanthamoeba castellanii str. Neff]ELR12898.1 biotin/lipoate A/B protein ligase family protein [Acanthamoeba castellanii str. Neff]
MPPLLWEGGGAESFNVDAFVKSLTTRALGRRVEYRTRVASTMDVGAQLLSEGAPHGTLVLAEEQAAPQARKQGRTWSSTPRGNLYASAVAVVRACEDAGVQEARVKWPNDVWIGHRKVSGMIMRTEKELDVDSWKAQIGIGINVNEDMSAHPDLRDVAVSVGQALGGLWGFEHAGYPAVVQAIADDFRLVVTRGGGGGDTISLSAEEVSVRPVHPSSSSSSSSSSE